jgi:DNA-directed RNA polymerase subunit RPC12/RpoP
MMETTFIVNTPLKLLDDYGEAATYLCVNCNNVFTADSQLMENIVWNAKKAILNVICPECGSKVLEK